MPFRFLSRWAPRLLAAASPFLIPSAPLLASGSAERAAARYARYRVTLDAADLSAAEALVRDGLASRPEDPELEKLRLRLLLPHHRFEEMVAGARAFSTRHPDDPESEETLGDGLIELGRYDEAFAAYSRFAAARPGTASFSRIALARAIGPDIDGAVAAMDLAADGARPTDPEGFAWCRAQAARLLLRAGRRAEAAGRLVEALRAVPGHAVSLALAADVAAREGRLEEAATLAERSLERTPDMSVAAALVDLRIALGDAAGRARAEALLRTLERLLPVEDRSTNRPLALFEADHGDAARALEMTRRELAVRKDVWGWDAFAWAAFRNGRLEEAADATRFALARGTVDPMLEFHAGVIAAASGEPDAAAGHLRRALSLDPRFHVVYAEDARRILRQLDAETAAR